MTNCQTPRFAGVAALEEPTNAKGKTMKLTSKELTQAIKSYARRNNLYARTVRVVTVYFNAAIAEHKQRQGVQNATS